MTDKDLADAIRKAADTLCIALDRAGEARLDVHCSFTPMQTQTFEDGSRACTKWQPNISVRRITSV